MQLLVSEIASSIQGEGQYTGFPTTFVRLHGCNLKCGYCDTRYACAGRKKRMSVTSVLSYIHKMGNQHVCITGGEPLLQNSVFCLIYDLVDRNYKVTIETNGAVEIEPSTYLRSYSYCMDIKCPSSNMTSKNIYSNLENLLAKDEVKFVISDRADYEFAKEVLKEHHTIAQIIFSPCFVDGKSNAKEISEWILEDKLINARLGVQVHKLIGVY